MNKTVEQVIKKCEEFGINVKYEDDLLDDEAITELDACFQNDENEERIRNPVAFRLPHRDGERVLQCVF